MAQEGRNAFQVALLPKNIKVCGEKKQESSNDLGSHILLYLLSPSQKKLILKKTKRKEGFKGGNPVEHPSPCKKKKIEKQKIRK